MTAFWPSVLPNGPVSSVTGGPQEARFGFQPDKGAALTRPRITGSVREMAYRFRFSAAQYIAFRAWFEDTLGNGSKPFVMREPVTREAYLHSFSARSDTPYQEEIVTNDVIMVSFSLVRRPAAAWFAAYMRPGRHVAPAFVADWDGGVFGIDDAPVAASALPGIAGTYDTFSVSDTDVETFAGSEVITAGDITEAQPPGIKRVVGFPAGEF